MTRRSIRAMKFIRWMNSFGRLNNEWAKYDIHRVNHDTQIAGQIGALIIRV